MAKRNLEMLRIAVENLGPLASELVFIGGCMTGLLITDEGAPEPRETKDVDSILEATSYAEYLTFSEKLKAQGFREDTADGAPLCRWVKQGTVLDVMPLDGKFSASPIGGIATRLKLPVNGNCLSVLVSE